MKNIIFFVLLFTITICQGQANEQESHIAKKKVVLEQSLKIDFLDRKYQKNGYYINDDINGNLYPSYSYYDKKIGSFSVNYIAKSLVKQNFWNINNKDGFFSKYRNPEDGSHDSKNILKHLNTDDYYIVVEYLPSKYIKFIGGKEEEFDIKPNAKTKFYVWKYALYKFGWGKLEKMYSEYFNYDKQKNYLLNHTKHMRKDGPRGYRHYHHLHLTGYDHSIIKIIKES